MMFVFPATAAKLDGVVLQAEYEDPPFVEWRYCMVQVPVPPPLSTTSASDNVCPAHTSATSGDFVAVGLTGSGTTVTVITFEYATQEPDVTLLTKYVVSAIPEGTL